MTTTINASPSNGLVQSADGSGILKVQSNGVTTNALAWVQFAGSGATITSAYNVSSITKNATGDFTLNFANNMTDASYSIVGNSMVSLASGGFMFTPYGVAPSVSSVRVFTTNAIFSATDCLYNSVAIFGN